MALSLAQTHEFFQDATEAIVLSDDWAIDRDRFGNIVRRWIAGKVLKPLPVLADVLPLLGDLLESDGQIRLFT